MTYPAFLRNHTGFQSWEFVTQLRDFIGQTGLYHNGIRAPYPRRNDEPPIRLLPLPLKLRLRNSAV